MPTMHEEKGQPMIDAKQYLRQYLIIVKEIDRNADEIKRIRTLAEKVTQTISTDRVQTSPRGDQLPDAVARIILLEDEITAKIEQMVTVRTDIEVTINRISDQRLRLLLNYRYLDGKTWEEIAVKMGLSYVHIVHRLHPYALKKITDVIECNIRSVV